MGAGAGVIGGSANAIGQIKADGDEAAAHRKNAMEYENNAAYIERVGKRKLSLLEREQGQFVDRQKSAFAKSGISFDGSVIDFIADTKVEQLRERKAVEMETFMEARFMRSKAAQSTSRAETLQQGKLFKGVTSFLGGYMSSGGFRSSESEA